MELVGISRVWTRLVSHSRNRLRVERADVAGPRRLRGPPRIHGLRSALLERRIVEKRPWPRVQDLVRDRRGLGRIARDELERAGVNALEHARETLEVHRVFEAVTNRLRDERMIRNLPIAWNVLEAGSGIRKSRRHEIVGLHSLKLRR